MGDLVSRLKVEGPQIWRRLSLFQRATLILVALGAAGAIVFLTQWAQQPEYSAVFTGLSDGDASAIVAKLKEMKVPYELADGGSTIRVPSNSVYDVRLQLVSQGLPKGGTVGYELFDKNNFGLTDFEQRLDYQRALEGELARTIVRISGIADARVHIVMPQDQLFTSKQNPATASIVASLRPGAQLDRQQVQAITTLVARSVEGLKPQNVTLVDGDGNLLSGSDSTASSGGLSGSQLDAQRSLELARQRDIQGMLEQVLGPRKAIVRVSEDLDWTQYESNSETFSPDGKPTQVRSSQVMTESSDTPLGDGSTTPDIPLYPATGGPAGPVSPGVTPTAVATPGATPVATMVTTSPTQTAATASQPKYQRKETTTNYEVSKLDEHVVKAPGAVKRQSISVMVDGQLDDATKAAVTNAVAAAAGVDQARGDTVVVTSMPFDQSAAAADQQSQKETDQRNLYFDIAKYALAGLSILIVLLMTRSFMSGLRGPRQKALGKGRGGQQRAVPAAAARKELPPLDNRPQLVQSEVTELAKQQPKLVAGIIKTWLDERETAR